MRKDNLTDKLRFVLGPEARNIALRNTPPGQVPSAEHLEAGIAALIQDRAIEKEVNRRLQEEFDKLNGRMTQLVTGQNSAMRGLMMTVGQVVRELSVIRRIMIIAGATSNEQAERLYEKAEPALVELRATMALWRQREGLEIPEFSYDEETRVLDQMLQTSTLEREENELERDDDER